MILCCCAGCAGSAGWAGWAAGRVAVVGTAAFGLVFCTKASLRPEGAIFSGSAAASAVLGGAAKDGTRPELLAAFSGRVSRRSDAGDLAAGVGLSLEPEAKAFDLGRAFGAEAGRSPPDSTLLAADSALRELTAASEGLSRVGGPERADCVAD
mmetsp:Transcript_23097/g.53438  ORF Transcript_23097/g.53438 Transcript_23097/m.53438 type:complete len:153 (+) Transcript_23097:717-1175(+)